MRTLLAVLLSFMLLPAYASAAPADPGLWWDTTINWINPVHTQKQSGVEEFQNTTGCAWNDQDDIVHTGYGDVRAGVTEQHSLCLVADYDDTGGPSTGMYPKVVALAVYAPTNSALNVSLMNDAGDSWVAPPGVREGNQRVTRFCIIDPVADRENPGSYLPDNWPLVPGTPGYGQIVNYTVSLSALKTVKNIAASFEVAHNITPPERWLRSTPCPLPDRL